MILTVETTLEVAVDFDYQPDDPSVGIAEAIVIDRVLVGAVDITAQLTQEQLDAIELAIWEERDALARVV